MSTSISAGNISGHWTAAGSPYLINGNVAIVKATSLIIDAGVVVEFQGHYKFEVFGGLDARGTDLSTGKISFTTTSADKALGAAWVGWAGLRIGNGDQQTSTCDHATGNIKLDNVEIAYVDKTVGPNGGTFADPYQDFLGNLYISDIYPADLQAGKLWLHHGRCYGFTMAHVLFSDTQWSFSNWIIEDFDTASGGSGAGSAIDVMHVVKADTTTNSVVVMTGFTLRRIQLDSNSAVLVRTFAANANLVDPIIETASIVGTPLYFPANVGDVINVIYSPTGTTYPNNTLVFLASGPTVPNCQITCYLTPNGVPRPP